MSELNYTQIIQNLNKGLSEKDSKLICESSKLLLQNKGEASIAIKEHYNNIVYNIDNGGQGITKYLEESILREILQNIVDCDYDDNIINIEISFDDEGQAVEFRYNENGFKISNIISLFSLDHTSKDSNNTGAFGIGAKGAILSAKKVTVESSHLNCVECLSLRTFFEIQSVEQSGKNTLKLNTLKLNNEINEESPSGTKLKLFLEKDTYNKIKENLCDIAGEKIGKGKYITPIDLVFASLKKINKLIKITISSNLLYEVIYKNDNVKFTINGEGVNFKVYIGDKSEFSYLIPYSRIELKDMPKYISDFSYNYFSTYELTGALGDVNLPKFYINIPTIDTTCENNIDTKYYITNDRKGIQDNKRLIVEKYIAKDFKDIISTYNNELLMYINKNYNYILKFLFEFLEFKLDKSECSELWRNNQRVFLNNILIQYDESNTYKLGDIKKYTYNSEYYELAKNFSNNSFLFMEEYYDFRRTRYDINIYFKFIFNGISLNTISHSCNVTYGHMSEGFDNKRDYINSKEYKKASVFDKLLYKLDYRDGKEILLLSAENDSEFSESTLLNLLKAINKNSAIVFNFNLEKKQLIVGDRVYVFDDKFRIRDKSILYYSYNLNSKNKVIFEFIRKIYLNTLIGKDKSDISNVNLLRLFRKNDLSFKFDHTKNNVIKVYLNYKEIEIPIKDDIDVAEIDYSELLDITGITNYSLLNNKSFDDFSILNNIVDNYGFDIDKIIKFVEDNNLDYMIRSILNKVMICSTILNLGNKDLVVFVKNNIIIKIVQIDSVINGEYKIERNIECDFIGLISHKNKDDKHSKINITRVSKFLDTLLSLNKTVEKLYKPVNSPIVKMIDQFDLKLKPILGVNKEEFLLLNSYIDDIDEDNKMFFAKDLNNKMYGYSTNCCICEYKSNILNAFQVRSGIEYRENNHIYWLTLYLCANDYFESTGWIISDVRFRDEDKEFSINFTEWLKKVKNEEKIMPNLLKCNIKIIKRSTYKIFSFNENDIQDAEIQEKPLILTPLMAVKWYSDNIGNLETK